MPCVPRYVPFRLQNRKGGTPRNFEMKRLFRNACSERSKRSEKERDKRSLHGAPGPCSQVRPFLLAELQRDAPRDFDMKRLIRNAFSERPILGRQRLDEQSGGRPDPICMNTPPIGMTFRNYTRNPNSPQTRQKYEQKSDKIGKTSRNQQFSAIFLFIFLPCMWGVAKRFPRHTPPISMIPFWWCIGDGSAGILPI